MTIIEKINLISEEAKNQFKPDLKKYGKNFRAISESALLEVLNPLFKNYNIAYEVIIDKSELTLEKVNAGVDTSGNLVQRLVFIALIKVRLIFQSENESFITEGLGSGIDSGDKATGKALTGAVKYALLKGLRLQYSDDPDAEASEDIEDIKESGEKKSHEPKVKGKKEEEPIATEAQAGYQR